MSPAQRSAMEAQIRSNGLKSLQGPVGQMFNQRRQFKAGLNMQLAGVINQTGQIVAGAEAQEAGLIANAAAARNNAYTSAARLSQVRSKRHPLCKCRRPKQRSQGTDSWLSWLASTLHSSSISLTRTCNP